MPSGPQYSDDSRRNEPGRNEPGRSDHGRNQVVPFQRKREKRHAQLTAAADVLQVLLQNSKSELSDGFLRWRLEQQWPEVVGASIAQQTLPAAFERGTLFIWVRHPTWMQQLWYFQDLIKEKVNAHIGRTLNGGQAREWCRQVKFTLSRRAATTDPTSPAD